MPPKMTRTLMTAAAWLAAAGSGLLTPEARADFPVRYAKPAFSGKQLLERISGFTGRAREQMIVQALLDGHMPSYLWNLEPVTFFGKTRDGRDAEITIFVMPDYLAVGDDRDFVRVPLSLPAAWQVARAWGLSLPTPKMVDIIHRQAHTKLRPRPIRPGLHSFAAIAQHHRMIEAQARATSGGIIAGHKKDVVICRQVVRRIGKVAIYGWHQPSGEAIQPISTLHGEHYADYSHGIRLIGGTALVNGRPTATLEVLEDRDLAPVISGDGSLADVIDHLERRFSGSDRAS